MGTPTQLLAGARAVIFAASASEGWSWTSTNTPRYVDYDGLQKVTASAVRNRVSRVLVVSSVYVSRPYHPIAVLLSALRGRIMHWKRLGELACIAETAKPESVTSYTIVRPGGLNNEPGKGLSWVAVGQGEGTRVPSPEDLALAFEHLSHRPYQQAVSRNTCGRVGRVRLTR